MQDNVAGHATHGNTRATSSEPIVIAEWSRLLLRDVDENPAVDVCDGELCVSVSGIRSSIVPLMPLTRRPGSLRRVTLRMTEPLTPEMSVGPFVSFMITEPLHLETCTVPSMAAMLIEPLTPLEVKLHG